MRKRFIAVAGMGALLVAAVATLDGPAQAGTVEVKAKLKTAAGVTIGNVAFREDTRSRVVTLRMTLRSGSGVSPGFHGFHVHANDNATNGDGCLADPAAAANTWFVSADGHFRHSTAEVHGVHAGDLSSVYVNANGTAELKMTKDALAVGAEREGRHPPRRRRQLRQRARRWGRRPVHAQQRGCAREVAGHGECRRPVCLRCARPGVSRAAPERRAAFAGDGGATRSSLAG